MQIRIVFDTGYELTVSLYDNDFVKRWCRLVNQEIARGSLLQEDTYSNFIPESLARQRLRHSITIVNEFLRREFISIPSDTDFDQPEFYNQLHQKFEQLAGPDWDRPSRLMCVAPMPVRHAVRHINRYCHTLETGHTIPYMRVEFDTTTRCELHTADYDLFVPGSEPNVAVLDYSTLGKSLKECWQDGLPATYAGVRTQHHYSANFVLRWQPEPVDNHAFQTWCTDQGVTHIPASELGYIELGKIDQPDSLEQVKKTAKIQSIIQE